MIHPVQWLARHDRDYAALRRAARTAVLMPTAFAVGEKVVKNAEGATFAAFGCFAMLLLVDFSGPMRQRLQSQASLAAAGCVLVVLGTLASRNTAVSVVAMVVVGFGVIFAGVVSSVLAGATTSLLLAFILPVSLPAPVSSIPDRLAGWAAAGAVAFLAVGLLWPTPPREPLRTAAAGACRGLAARLRSEIGYRLSSGDPAFADDFARASAASDARIGALHTTFLTLPYRPTGLSTATRTVVRLVDELSWLHAVVVQSTDVPAHAPVNRTACALKLAAAETLEQAAALLEQIGGDPAALEQASARLTEAMLAMERHATDDLPVRRERVGDSDEVAEVLTSLHPGFRAQELSFAVQLIARNVALTAAAERRGWVDRLLGRQPEGVPGTWAAAGERAGAHVERHSVWMHNSVRGAVALGLAVLVADVTAVQHSFWVILGTLSVLRSSALNTGQNVIRGLLGTVAGFVIGALLLAAIGTSPGVLWTLLPFAILVAGVAPAAISFAAGQAGFTVVLVILFNIIQPAGWRIGLLRVEDIALGCAVSLVVGLLFWPRGAGAALRQALAEAYLDSTAYLTRAVEYGVTRADGTEPDPQPPVAEATRAAAAARRLDDTFRNYLAERGPKPLPLAHVTGLVTGVAGVRLAADAVIDLWQRDDGECAGARQGAAAELRASAALVRDWYADLAGSLLDHGELRDPLPHDRVADGRLIEAVRRDLVGSEGRASATAVRMIWTGDHLDAVRRLQQAVIGPARAAGALPTDDVAVQLQTFLPAFATRG